MTPKKEIIDNPDTDLADPVLNTSGVPWHTLYYQANYPRLQRIKARYRHNLEKAGLSPDQVRGLLGCSHLELAPDGI